MDESDKLWAYKQFVTVVHTLFLCEYHPQFLTLEINTKNFWCLFPVLETVDDIQRDFR